MKKTLLILCACLFGALTGVRAWTSVAPQVGKTYYLLNTEYSNNFFYASTSKVGGSNQYFGVTTDLMNATPVKIGESGDGDYPHTLAFYLNNDETNPYYVYHSKGSTSLSTNPQGFYYDENGGSYIIRNDKTTPAFQKTHYRYLDAKGAGSYCDFTNSDSHIREWQFVACEELMEYMSAYCASVAEAKWVKSSDGWERVTSVDMLKTNPENYFFAIFSANTAGLMVRTEATNGQGYYLNGANPLNSSADLFGIENYNYNSEDYFVMKAENTNGYYYPNPEAYNLFAPSSKSVKDDNCRLTFEYANNAWNIKTWAVYDNGSYWGLWQTNPSANDYQGYKDGASMAGNKTSDYKGSFLIYRKLKKNVDMTSRTSSAVNDWTATSGTKALKDGYIETYNGNDTPFAVGNVLYQTINNLPNGNYVVSFYAWENFSNWNDNAAIAYGNDIAQVFANDAAQGFEVIKNTGGRAIDDTNKYTLTCSVTDGTLTYGVKNVATGGNWAVCQPISLTYLGEMATEEDYTALENAISNAESKTLGFDDGEYAPYNNIAAINALAAAKAINKEADNIKVDVHNAISAIANDNWTANSGEVSAISLNASYDGSKDADNRYYALGWGKAGGTDAYNTRIIKGTSENPGMAAVDDEIGLFTKFGTVYGQEAGYTMPLKANTVYQLSFKYGAFGEDKQIVSNLSIADGEDNSVSITPSSFTRENNSGMANSSTEAWFDYTGTFKTNAAGNYVLTLTKNDNSEQRQIVMGNIELKRYNGMIEEDDTNTQVYYGTFKSRVDLTPTEEHPFVDITHASFDGDVFVNLDDNPNGLVYATPSQVSSIKSSYGTTEAIPNVVSNDGNVCESLVIYDGHPFFVPSHSNIRATEATYSRGGVSNTFGTICLPFDVSSDENVQYYTTDQIVGNVLKLTEVTTVLAGTPAIFKKSSEATEITAAANNVAIKDAGEAGTSVKLVGTFTEIVVGDVHGTDDTAANNYYYIKNNQFWQGKNYFYIPAFRAYLDAAGSSNARLSLQIDDETTAINELKTLDEKQGLKDGKYLIGGKIIVVKDGKQFNVNGVLK